MITLRRALLVLVISCFTVRPTIARTKGWLPRDFPPPPKGSRVSDPDGILKGDRREALEGKLRGLEERIRIPGLEHEPVQLAVAVVEKVRFNIFTQYGDESAPSRFSFPD